jgi:hypothetical protein
VPSAEEEVTVMSDVSQGPGWWQVSARASPWLRPATTHSANVWTTGSHLTLQSIVADVAAGESVGRASLRIVSGSRIGPHHVDC